MNTTSIAKALDSVNRFRSLVNTSALQIREMQEAAKMRRDLMEASVTGALCMASKLMPVSLTSVAEEQNRQLVKLAARLSAQQAERTQPEPSGQKRTPKRTKEKNSAPKLPRDPELLKLIHAINRELPKGGTQRDIVSAFFDGDETRTKSAERQLRRYKHLLTSGQTADT